MDRFFFRFVTIHTFDELTDRLTERQTEFSSLDRVCIPCSSVKKPKNLVFYNPFLQPCLQVKPTKSNSIAINAI